MQGWIKLHRKLKDHWIWKSDNRLKWWIDILLSVNHSEKKVLLKNTLVTCKRGQTVKSLGTWAKDWNVTKKTVSDFFKLLESDGMIETENIKITTRLTVLNYDIYNESVDATETLSKREVNATETLSKRYLRTNKNEKKEENVNNEEKGYKRMLLSEIKISDLPTKNIDYLEITKSFFQLFRNNLIEAGASTKKIDRTKGGWIDSARLIVESDNYTIEELRKVFKFLQHNEFWKKNILSLPTLREKMDKLLMEIKYKRNGKSTDKGATQEELAEILYRHTKDMD
jgi:hypothetical protein